MHIANIVVATDLSEHCGCAARWAEHLKKHTGARVIVEHVIEISVMSWLSSAYDALDDENLRKQAEAKVEAWYEHAAGAPPDAVELRAGSCVQQLTEFVNGLDDPEATITVLSATGKGALTRLLVGSTAHSVASQPPCPVVIVHPEHETPPTDTPIIVGTDFSFNADKAVEFAAGLTRILDTQLLIVHANAAPQFSAFEGGAAAEDVLKKSSLEMTQTGMHRVVGRIDVLQGANFELEVLDDEPAEALIGLAETEGSDLVILGHSGESPFVQTFLGSVAQKVLGHMPCTLIIIPAEESADEEE